MTLHILVALVVVWVIVRGLIRFAPRIGLVDRPNERSLHTRATPRGGGIGFVVVIFAGVVLGAWGRPEWMLYGAAGLMVAGLSLWDDFRSLGAGIRLGGHLLAAVAVFRGIGTLGVLPGGIWIDTVLTVLWVVGLTNVYNFMDGSDGIAATQGLVAGGAWAIAGHSLGMSQVALLGALLAGCCFGFLWHNWSPAKIFMGDVGSAFLGFTFATIPLLALADNRDSHVFLAERLPVFAAMVVWPFIGDGFLTFWRRVLRREKVWAPHRSHLYQRLIQSGWSHSGVAILYGIWAILSSAAGYSALIGVLPCWTVIGVAVVTLGGVFIYTCKVEARAKGCVASYKL